MFYRFYVLKKEEGSKDVDKEGEGKRKGVLKGVK